MHQVVGIPAYPNKIRKLKKKKKHFQTVCKSFYSEKDFPTLEQ